MASPCWLGILSNTVALSNEIMKVITVVSCDELAHLPRSPSVTRSPSSTPGSNTDMPSNTENERRTLS